MLVKQGTTGKAVGIFVRQSDGTAYTGLAYNASGFKCYYIREGGSVTAVTLDGTNWTETDATNMPGRYKFIIPDAALASSAKYVEFEFFGAADMLPVPLRIELVAFDPFTDFTTQVSGIKTQTDKLSFDASNHVRTLVMELDMSPVDQVVEGVLNVDMAGFTATGSLAAITRAIKTKTDQLSFTMANKVDTTVYGMYTTVADQIAQAVWASDLAGWGEAGDALYSLFSDGVSVYSILPGAQNAIKSQMDASLDTAIPTTPTAGSINDKIKKLTFDGSNNVNAGMQAIGAGVLGAIQNTVWSADPGEWVGVGAGGTIQEVWDMVNGIINTYDGQGYIQAIVMDIEPNPRTAIASDVADAVWSEDLEGYSYPGTPGNILYTSIDQIYTAVAEIDSMTSAINGMTGAIKSKTDHLTFDANDWVQAYTNGGTIETFDGEVDLSPYAKQGIWDWATGFISSAGSIGKLIKDNLNAAVSSRAAAGDQMSLTNGTIDSVAAGVWAANGRSLDSAVDVSSDGISAIANAVWNEPTLGYIADTYGELMGGAVALNYGHTLDVLTKVNSIQLDLNEEPLNLVSYKYRMVTSSGVPIEGVTIRVTRDRDGLEEAAPDQETDSNGETNWILMPGTYYVTRTKVGQTYSNPDVWRIEG